MKLFDYIDVNFRNLSYENSIKHTIKRDGEMQALMTLVTLQRRYYKFISFFAFVANYLFTLIHLKNEPANIVPQVEAPKPDPKQKPKFEVVPTPPELN